LKKTAIMLVLTALLSLLVLYGGCGEEAKNGGSDIDAGSVEFDKGFEEGEKDGYEQGYDDGIKGDYETGDPEEADEDDPYAQGYNQGWVKGYEEGYEDGVAEADKTDKELAEVEAAMLEFVKQNAAPGLEFKIENIVIHGDEAAGIAVCTSETLESPLVLMKKGASGWNAVDFGTGIEPPSWYPY
jgi:hypothetical protein